MLWDVIQVVPVEKTGDDAWAGVAAVDDGKEDPSAAFRRIAVLAGGDIAALLLFAAAGRNNHSEAMTIASVLDTALPFIAGWFLSASLLGGFNAEAQQKGPVSAALTAAKCWAVGTPTGLVLRGLSRGYVPPTPFIFVSLGVTLVLLGGWRAAYAATYKPEEVPKTPGAAIAARKNRQGGPLEFIQLLMSLVRRW